MTHKDKSQKMKASDAALMATLKAIGPHMWENDEAWMARYNAELARALKRHKRARGGVMGRYIDLLAAMWFLVAHAKAEGWSFLVTLAVGLGIWSLAMLADLSGIWRED